MRFCSIPDSSAAGPLRPRDTDPRPSPHPAVTPLGPTTLTRSSSDGASLASSTQRGGDVIAVSGQIKAAHVLRQAGRGGWACQGCGGRGRRGRPSGGDTLTLPLRGPAHLYTAKPDHRYLSNQRDWTKTSPKVFRHFDSMVSTDPPRNSSIQI